MSTRQLFTNVSDFYTNMSDALTQAEESIHMVYYAFDNGRFARKIGHILAQKAASGIPVHLMVDEMGLYMETVSNAYENRQLLDLLAAAGVQVDIFRPNGRRLTQFNRLHCKFCAIDNKTVFVGGSNIGDHYLKWRDSNMRLDGDFGDGFPKLYDSLHQFIDGKNGQSPNMSTLQIADMPLLLTVPGRRQDIRRGLLDLILSAKTAVYIRSWYFLPDKEILNALLTQAENGVRVTILFSHRTRVPLIDIANRWLTRRLSKAGVKIYRYADSYMHAKEAWNDQGDVIFGSANTDLWALHSNFECSLHITDTALAHRLTRELYADVSHCLTPEKQTGRLLPTPQFA